MVSEELLLEGEELLPGVVDKTVRAPTPSDSRGAIIPL
jgi:hypothetical protein